jgi:hypothetical protein
MNQKLKTIGYLFEPSKYSPALGYSALKVVISDKPTQRFFDVKLLSVPTFDGRFFRHTQVTRHELSPTETFRVCLGELRLETHQGEILRAFSFGGNLRVFVEMGDLFCEFTSNAPLFQVQSQPISESGVITDEIMDLLAELETELAGHEDELFSRLAKIEPYPLFLSCLVSINKRAENIPMAQRREGYHKVMANLNHTTQILRDTDGWDGHAPSLEELLKSGGI